MPIFILAWQCVLVHLYVCLRVLVQCKQFTYIAFVGLRICVFVYFCNWVVVLLMCLCVCVFLYLRAYVFALVCLFGASSVVKPKCLPAATFR